MSSPVPPSSSKIIFLTQENPFPPAGGAHLRDAQLVGLLRESMEIEILCYASEDEDGLGSQRNSDEAVPLGVKVTRIRRRRSPIWQKALSPLRPDVRSNYCPAMEQAIRERAVRQDGGENLAGTVMWISRLGMAKYQGLAKQLGFRTVLDQHQVETQVLWNNAYETVSSVKTAARGLTDLALAAQCGYYEGRICRESDAVVATSDLDASRLLRLAPGAPVHIIPHAVDCAHYAPLRSQPGRDILFTGALNYAPNIEGVTWFLQEVWPKLKTSLGPKCPKLVVAGSNPSAEMRRLLDAAGAKLHADPPSLLPFLADAAVVIVPLRSGRSMRLKILEAMAAGRAVVSTPRGAEGLLLAPGYDIWIADPADKFASAVSRLVENPALRTETGEHAAQTADARYDWSCSRALLEALFRRLSRPAPITD